MRLRMKQTTHDVTLDSSYVRWPRPSIRGYVRFVDERIRTAERANPGIDWWDMAAWATPLPRVSQRVIYPIPF